MKGVPTMGKPETSIHSLIFDDFDLFQQSLAGWDLEVTQVSRGPLWLEWDQVTYGDHLTISHLNLNRDILDLIAINPGRLQFVVCFTPNVFCGIPVDAGSMEIFGPGRDYRSRIPAGFDTLEISISEELLRSIGLQQNFSRYQDLAPEKSVLKLQADRLAEFRTLSRIISMNRQNGPSATITPLRAAAIRDHTLTLLASTLNEATGNADPVPQNYTKGWLLADRALNQIDKREPYMFSIPELAGILGCSDRTLQLAFRESLGISPSQYLLACRLQKARKDLLSASASLDNVASVATEHEFFHFGRFSQYYLSMFGEKPSDTLKKARETSHAKFSLGWRLPVSEFVGRNDAQSKGLGEPVVPASDL